MCLQDLQIGYATRHTPKYFTVGTTAVKLLNHNPKRWGILWGNPSSNLVWIGFDSTIAAGRGMVIQNSMQAPFWNVTLHGDAVTEEIWAVAGGANIAFSLVEVEFAGL